MRHMIVSDNDGHWYVIREFEEMSFHDWVDAMETDGYWDGHDFEEDRIYGSPSLVRFESYEIDD